VSEATRVLRPGGQLIISDWMRTQQMGVLDEKKITAAWNLAGLESLQSYEALLRQQGLEINRADDVGAAVLPNARIMAALTLPLALEPGPDAQERNDRTRWRTQFSALASAWLARRLTIGVIHGRKPEGMGSPVR
tara:strand:- start:1227 stop:1631 length:405 start_codon:yes stop_codon:yes gene_type:complete